MLLVIALLLCRRIRRQRLVRYAREVDIDKLNKEIEQSLAQLSQLRQQQEQLTHTSNGDEVQHLQQQIDSLQQATDNGLGNIIKVLNGVVYDSTKNKAIKSDKLSKIMDNDFFDQLHIYINVRYDNLIQKLRAPEFKLNDVDINTICLELCHMPNPVIWSYLGVKSLHSVITRKSLIASKVGGLTKIADIPEYIKSASL